MEHALDAQLEMHLALWNGVVKGEREIESKKEHNKTGKKKHKTEMTRIFIRLLVLFLYIFSYAFFSLLELLPLPSLLLGPPSTMHHECVMRCVVFLWWQFFLFRNIPPAPVTAPASIPVALLLCSALLSLSLYFPSSVPQPAYNMGLDVDDDASQRNVNICTVWRNKKKQTKIKHRPQKWHKA